MHLTYLYSKVTPGNITCLATRLSTRFINYANILVTFVLLHIFPLFPLFVIIIVPQFYNIVINIATLFMFKVVLFYARGDYIICLL